MRSTALSVRAWIFIALVAIVAAPAASAAVSLGLQIKVLSGPAKELDQQLIRTRT